MAAYRSTTQAVVSASPLVINAPAGLVAGDVLIAVLELDVAAATPPAGWTVIASSNLAWMGYKVALAGDVGSTFTFTNAGGLRLGGTIAAYSGAAVDVVGSVIAGSGTSIVAPSVTTTVPGDVVAYVVANDFNGGVTPPAALTSRFNTTVGSNPYETGVVADIVAVSAGATATQTFTNTGSNDIGIAVVALKTAAVTALGRRGFAETIQGFRGRGVLTF